jgi:hypothetical protein
VLPKLPSDKADVLQSVREQNRLNKTAASNVSEYEQPLDFLPYFQTIVSVILQETKLCIQQDANARNEPDIPGCQPISMKDLYAFLASIVQMGHDHKLSMKLY